jgi:hypothetical protein
MKKTLYRLIIAALLPAIVQTASATVLFSDNFNINAALPGYNSDNNQDLNFDFADRQAGPLAPATYTGNGGQHQVGNTGTYVGQPGGAAAYGGGYLLMAFNGDCQSDLNIAAVSAGPLTIEFDLFEQTNSSTEWGAFSLRAPGSAFPVAGATEFGFLRRHNGGVQVFQNGSVAGTGSWDTGNFALDPHWKLIFTDTTGTGSAFVGNGSQVTMINGTTTLGTLTLGQLQRSGLKLGFNASGPTDPNAGGIFGLDNLAISGTPPATAVTVTTTNESGSNPFTPDWTPETPNLIAGLLPTIANGNFTLEGAGGMPVLTDGTIGTSGSIGGFATCGGGSGSGSTLVYTLTNSLNGSDVTNIVVYSGWGDGGRFGQYYDLSYSTVSAPTTFIPITTVFYLPGNYSGAPACRVAIAMSNGAPLASGVANIKFDFGGPPNANNFNNGYQGYSEIIVQGTNTATPPPPPSGYLTQDTLPSYAETVVGDQVVFTAGFSNFPPVSLQWQVISGGTTNNINTGVLNVTNNDNVTSTLTLNNVQTNSSGLYRLQANNATNNAAAPSYSMAQQLVVGSTPAPINNVIVNYAAQSFPNADVNFFPPWPVDTNDLNLIYGSTSGTGPGTFVQVGDFTGTGTQTPNVDCNGDATILSDGFAGPLASIPSSTFVAGGPLIDGAGQSVTYTLPTTTYGYDITNITSFGGWQDNGRNEQKYQVLYSTAQSPTSFVPLLTADYVPGGPSSIASVSRMTLVPVNGVLAHNVAALEINFNVSPAPEHGWEGYSEILVGGQPTTGFVPALTSDVAPSTASDVVGSQVMLMAGFSGATSLQWKKNGTNVVGATTSKLTLNNLQLTDAGAYTLVASNAVGATLSSACTVTVNPAPTATNNIITAIATQTSVAQVFTPTWDTNVLLSSLIYNIQPSSAGDEDFSGGSFNGTPTGGSQPDVLTDGTFGTIDFNQTGLHAWVTCIGSGTGVNNDQGGNYVTYTLPASPNGYSITNIMTAGGWNDAGRDEQSYTVSYATVANPTFFIPLAVVVYNPNSPNGYSMSRATLTAANGVLASNVAALQFDMTTPAGENGYSGYSEIAVYGSPAATPPPAGLVITAEHQEDSTSWTAETPNLIAGQLPSSQGPGVFTGEGCNVTNLTDGVLGFGAAFGAACGTDPSSSVSWMAFNAATGWDLTNIVVYTMWHDYGRDGQFYNLSYSTWSAPTTFLPLASVNINPPMPQDGRASGLRVAIAPQVGQILIASNVAAVKFDFTPQGTQDFSWSGYTEIVLQGSNLALVKAPILGTPQVSGGNLILTGTGGTPSAGYTWLTTTNLAPPVIWTTNSTGTLDINGAFSNSIPIGANPARFFKLRLP